MGPYRGLDVQVISNNKPLELYDDPDDVSNNPRIRQHYIEAVTGASFEVKITLDESFKLYSLEYDDAVRISVTYDNQKPNWYIDLTVRHLRSTWNSGKHAEYTFRHINKFNKASQQWKKGATTFGALKTSKLFSEE